MWPFKKTTPTVPAPNYVVLRQNEGAKALILLHGFTGTILDSWNGFHQNLLADTNLADWDIFGITYPSTKSIDRFAFFSGDPSLVTLSVSLGTTLGLPPFENYDSLAIAAHSMGGLFAQRAILDNNDLAARIKHLFLFGTPSLGIAAAQLISPLKKQAQDMTPGSQFISTLREDWNLQFGKRYPFSFWTVAGEIDEFVPPNSSLSPFQRQHWAVVPGDHGSIIRPAAPDHQGVGLVRSVLAGSGKPADDGVPLALEQKEFQSVVNTLLPNKSQLDEAALISLAFALDGLDRGNDALDVLQERFQAGAVTSSEGLGALAGRIKRRWLVERVESDLRRASELYLDGYLGAAKHNDHEQAFYHSINLAFLSLISSPLNSKIPAEATDFAEKATWHCSKAPFSNWRVATQAEAQLILADAEAAYGLYEEAVAATESPRQLGSMYSQGSRIALRLHGQRGLTRMKTIFDRFHE